MASSSRRYYSPAVGYFVPADTCWYPYDPDLTHAKPWVKKFCTAADADDHPWTALIKQRVHDLTIRERDAAARRRMPYIVARQLALKKNQKNATPQRRLLALEDAPDDVFRVVVSFL